MPSAVGKNVSNKPAMRVISPLPVPTLTREVNKDCSEGTLNYNKNFIHTEMTAKRKRGPKARDTWYLTQVAQLLVECLAEASRLQNREYRSYRTFQFLENEHS